MSHYEEKYHFYWSGPFSQWSHSQFVHSEQQFQTAEQAMMYEKAVLFGDHDIAAQILSEGDPGRQKALGRRVRGFDETHWDKNKVRIVTEINRSKFGQNKGLRRKLFHTIPLQLVEASPVDTIWGIGLDAADAHQTPPELWPGQNLLGKILTQVRKELVETYPEEAQACAPNTTEENR
ncbi:NADAR family protein [Parasedimentitalea maritima]|uniref:NADAR family protein n=1 Tax=Parasedimentitalea maritima TaxID=2578117 RepID=A0ABY2USY5_9RHOB|nr:NADAR family protein [Zongyanglinia marina]TLP60339.1 NADAR family protein [Zongyanglinia marina]